MASDQTILLVDDDQGLTLLVKRVLVKLNYRTIICHDGASALLSLESELPDLLLLDLGLPDISGQQLLKEMEARGQQIPHIIISGTSDLRVAVELMQKGAADFLLKDTNMLTVVGPRVERVLESVSLEKDLRSAEKHLFHISKTIQDVFWMMNAKGNELLHVSPAFEKIWGYPLKSLYDDANFWNETIIEIDRSKAIRAFALIRDGEEDEADLIYRIQDKAGIERWIRDRVYATRDEQGNLLYLTGVATDITERKRLEGQVVEATEHERIRIGQDLHDDLCQRLAALKLSCGQVLEALAEEEHSHTEMMREIVKEIGEATAYSRSIAKGLSPVSLEEEGLMVALENLTEMVESRFGIPCRFDCPRPVKVAGATRASHIFRIAQELLNNAAKHANASRALLGLYPSSGGFKLELVHDGIPFSGVKPGSQGMGLHLIKFRADAIGASLEYFPGKRPDGGTRVVCSVPLRDSVLEIKEN